MLYSQVSDRFNNLSGVIMRLAELETTLDELPTPPFVQTEANTAASGTPAAAAAAAHFIRNDIVKPPNPSITIDGLSGRCADASVFHARVAAGRVAGHRAKLTLAKCCCELT